MILKELASKLKDDILVVENWKLRVSSSEYRNCLQENSLKYIIPHSNSYKVMTLDSSHQSERAFSFTLKSILE